MKKTDRKVFVPLLNAVADLHGKKLSDAVVGIYWDCLQAIDLAAFQTAMRELTMESEYMPKPADIIRHVRAARKPEPLAEPVPLDQRVDPAEWTKHPPEDLGAREEWQTAVDWCKRAFKRF